MRKEHEDHVAADRPALLVLYGATRKKVRPLDGELTVLGRAPGCDIGLVSPEVAPVHCVIVRLESGWRIRDCSGRSTRVNGKAITDEPLRNGDVLQVGTFSFEAHLPPLPPASPRGGGPAANPAVVERLRASRRRLAELALNLRRRFQEQAGARAEVGRREAELAAIERRARAAHQELQGRKAELEDIRRGLDRREAELNAYAVGLRRQAERGRAQQRELDEHAEAELMRGRREVQAEREALLEWRQQLQVRQADVEAMVHQLEEALTSEREELERDRTGLSADRAALDEQRRELQRQAEALARLRADTPAADRTPAARSTRETQYDEPDSLEAARQLLRQVAQRRKATETKHDEARAVGGKAE